MAKQPNYSEDEVKYLLQMYDTLGNKGLDEIAEKLKKSVVSVRSKLIKEGVYVAEEKKPKRKNGPNKKELLQELRQLTGGELDGLLGATKPSIQELIDIFKKQIKAKKD